MAAETTTATVDDLTAFQRDLLAVLAREGPEYGLAIKRALADDRNEAVNHGRLYPNLDDLVEQGLVEKRALDRRTNEYGLTDAGQGELRMYRKWLTNCLEASDE